MEAGTCEPVAAMETTMGVTMHRTFSNRPGRRWIAWYCELPPMHWLYRLTFIFESVGWASTYFLTPTQSRYSH